MHLNSVNRIQGFCSSCWPAFVSPKKKKREISLPVLPCLRPDLSYTLRGIVTLFSCKGKRHKLPMAETDYEIGKNMCFILAVWAFCSVIWLITKAHSQNCIPAFRMQLTKLQKADLVSFADGLWVSCGIILNYIGSQSLVLKRCSELRVVMCLDHSVGKQALKLIQLLWRAAVKGPAEQAASNTLKDYSSPCDALWGWPSNPTMGCGAFCRKGRRLDQLIQLFFIFISVIF